MDLTSIGNRHLRRVSKRQWQSGKPIKGERNCCHLWDHLKRTNQEFAHQVSRTIAEICAAYPGSILLFERLRTIQSKGEGKTRRLNRKLANQIRGLIRDYAKEKAFACGTVTVEVNPHGTSQYCSRCGAKGERFSYRNGQRVKERGGKLLAENALLDYRPGGRSIPEGHPCEGMPGPYANEHTWNVVGL